MSHEASELPNYFENFQPVRVNVGDAIGRRELGRRLAHYLQVPQRFGTRIQLAYESVLKDAMEHGEGFTIPSAGTLVLLEHKDLNVELYGKMVPRTSLYRYKWRINKGAKDFIRTISRLKLEGLDDDSVFNPENQKLQSNTGG